MLKNLWARNYESNGFFIHASSEEGQHCVGYTMDNLLASGNRSYGLFAKNCFGGKMINSAGYRQGDSAFYVGACQRVCNAVLNHVHAQNSALGFSGTNAGNYAIRASEWDLNRAGIVPNSLANDDPPSPQNGACPVNPARFCTFIQGNWVHDNNNPNTPAIGLTAGAPVGTPADSK